MKRLYLLRHAESLSTASEDQYRELSTNGFKQARALAAAQFTETEQKPDYIACSPATRTKQTLDQLSLENVPVDFPDSFYYITPEGLLNFLSELDDAHNSVLIINHNPAIHQFAFMMIGTGPDEKIQSLSMRYKPCTLTILDCPIESWSDIDFGQNMLIDLIPPEL